MNDSKHEFAIDRVPQRKRLRRSVPSPLRVVELAEPWDDGWPIVPGSILIAWGRDEVLDEFISRLTSRSSGSSRWVIDAWRMGDESTLELPGDVFDQAPAIAEIRYAGQTILDGIVRPAFLDGIDTAIVPWLGAQFDQTQFGALEWILDGSTPSSFVLATNPPRVSDDEQRVLGTLDAGIQRPSNEPMNTVVASVIATAVVSHYVDKTLDKVDRKVGNWAKQQERQAERAQRAAEKRAAENAFRNRTQWRNAGIARSEPPVSPASRADHPRTIMDLL